MPSITDVAWSRTTQVFESRGADGYATKQTVKTAKTATIVDAPVLPDHNTHVTIIRTWQPTAIRVDTRVDTGFGNSNRDGYRVTISGHYLKKDGTPSKVAVDRSWMRFANGFTGRGSLAQMLPWVADLVTELEHEASE